MTKWVKKTGKTNISDGEITSYIDDDENRLEIIEDTGYSFNIRYWCKNMKNKDQFFQEVKARGFSILGWVYSETKKTKDEIKLLQFLEIVDKYNSISEIKEEIFIKIGTVNIKEIFLKTIKEEMSINKLFEIVLNYQDKGFYAPIWEVINLINEDINKEPPFFTPQQLFDFIPKVIKENPFYKSANDISLHLLYTQDVSSDDKILFLEKKLEYAMKSEDQMLVDQIFHELSGSKGLIPEITDVKGDVETLIRIAKKMRELNNKIENLQLKENTSANEENCHTPTFWK